MPPSLSETEQDEWLSLMADLETQGTVTTVDGKSAYQYCKLFAETEAVAVQQSEARAGLAILEENLGRRDGEEKLSPEDIVQLFQQIVTLQKLVSKCTDQLRQGRMAIRQYLVEFGLTPASRGRIKLPPKAETADDFEQHQKLRMVK